MLTNYGQAYFFKTGFTEETTPPANFQIGLSKSNEVVLGKAITLGSINEVTGSGYSRQNVASDAVDWVLGLDAGDYQASSKEVSFSANGTWDTALSMFLTDGTGVIATLNLYEEKTLIYGAVLKCTMRIKHA